MNSPIPIDRGKSTELGSYIIACSLWGISLWLYFPSDEMLMQRWLSATGIFASYVLIQLLFVRSASMRLLLVAATAMAVPVITIVSYIFNACDGQVLSTCPVSVSMDAGRRLAWGTTWIMMVFLDPIALIVVLMCAACDIDARRRLATASIWPIGIFIAGLACWILIRNPPLGA